MAYFKKSTDKRGEYRFNLHAGNGQVILSSEGYKTTASRDNGIASVQKNSQDEKRYEDRESKSGQYYFVLKASNGQVIGSSEMYTSSSGRDNGKASVMKNGSTKEIKE